MMRSFFKSVVGLTGKPKAQVRSRSKAESRLNGLGFDRLETRSMLAVAPVAFETHGLTVASQESAVSAPPVMARLTVDESAPRDLMVIPGDGFVNLIWREPSIVGMGQIRNYRVFISEDAGTTWTKVTRPPSTNLSATVAGLTNDKLYSFRLQARDGSYLSRYSRPVSVIPRSSLDASVTPFNVVARQGDGKATLSWSPPNRMSGRILDYVIRYTTDGQTWKKVVRPASTDLTATVEGLTNGTRYAFRVRALTSAGPTRPSAASSFVTPATTPGTPTNIVASVVSKGTVTLTWDAPDDGGKPIIEYDISWDANRDATPTFNEGPVQVFNGVGESAFFCGELHVRETVRVSSGQRASVTLSDLHPDASYTFYVRARNLLGSGAIAISNEVKTPALT